MRLALLMAFATVLPALTALSPEPTPLERAVDAFNDRVADDSIGRVQPPLTVEAVVAAIRWTLLKPEPLQLSPETIFTLREIAENHALPEGYDLESLTGYEPNDQVVFEVWSVRLRVPGGPHPGGTTCVRIQERMIGSRLIGDEERKVIDRWRPIWGAGVGSMARHEYVERYRREREEAAERDRAGDR